MDFLKNAALCLIAAAALGTLATVIVPRGSMDKTLRAVVGIFVVAVICSPLAEIPEAERVSEVFVNSFEASSDEIFSEDMQKQMLEIIESTIISNIKETASELNVNVVSVNPELSVDADHCINIHKITVKVSECNSSLKEYLSVKISENLGVSAEVIAE